MLPLVLLVLSRRRRLATDLELAAEERGLAELQAACRAARGWGLDPEAARAELIFQQRQQSLQDRLARLGAEGPKGAFAAAVAEAEDLGLPARELSAVVDARAQHESAALGRLRALAASGDFPAFLAAYRTCAALELDAGELGSAVGGFASRRKAVCGDLVAALQPLLVSERSSPSLEAAARAVESLATSARELGLHEGLSLARRAVDLYRMVEASLSYAH